MELFLPLTGFCNAIEDDSRIEPLHICIYMALLQEWNLNGGTNSILVFVTKIMKQAKINPRHTYNKFMNNLDEYGYMCYHPPANGFTGSMVFLVNCEKKSQLWKT